MARPVQREFYDRCRAFIVDRLTDFCVELTLEIIGPKNLAPNALDLARDERIMQTIEDWEAGILDEMAITSPKMHALILREFNRDLDAAAPELLGGNTITAADRTFAPGAAPSAPAPFGGV